MKQDVRFSYSSASAGGPIQDLVAFDIRNEMYPPSLAKWRERVPVVMPQSFARQLWFFNKSLLETFPKADTDKFGIKLMFGRDAYVHLLKVMVGADSEKVGETNIAGQFNTGWIKFCREHPDHVVHYNQIVQNLWMDSSLIRNHFVSKIQSQRHEMAARYLNAPKGGETILIVGDLNSDGTLAHTTNHIIRAFGGNTSKQAAEIIVTSPDDNKLDHLLYGIEALREKGFIRPPATKVPFEALPIGFEVADMVFVAIPMRPNSDPDVTMISTWKNRQRHDNWITHLRGDPFEYNGGSTPEWENAELDHYIPVEKVREKVAEIGRRNDYLILLTHEAVEYCADCRVNNQRPDKKLMARLSELTESRRDQMFVRAVFSGRVDLAPGLV